MRPRQNGRHFPDDILKWIFLNENVWISTEISLKFVPRRQISNILPLVQIMAWRRPGDKPLSESMMVSLLTHICVTRPQWVNTLMPQQNGRYFAVHIQVHFFQWKLLNFEQNFTEICALGSNWQYGSIGSDNGLAPNRWLTIIWSNVGMLYWCIYAWLDLSELKH